MRVLAVGADRSKRGILYPGSLAFERQRAYAKEFGELDIIGFSRVSDDAHEVHEGTLSVHPTESRTPFSYGFDAMRIAKRLPRPDVVSVQDPFETGLVGYLIARRFGVPLHVQVHTDFLAPAFTRHSILNRIRVGIASYVLRRAVRIRVVSERVKDELESTGIRTPIAVLPIFVDTAQFRVAAAPASLITKFAPFKTRLLVVSRLESEKNVALAIESFAKAAPNDSCLIIVGEGRERTRLELLARELGVGDRVYFEGERPGIEYYPLIDLVLVPSLYEGYGLVVIEALAAGKPVLSTNVGAAKQVGAIIASQNEFALALKDWFETGPRRGELAGYPYKNFEEYVCLYADDVKASVSRSVLV